MNISISGYAAIWRLSVLGIGTDHCQGTLAFHSCSTGFNQIFNQAYLCAITWSDFHSAISHASRDFLHSPWDYQTFLQPIHKMIKLAFMSFSLRNLLWQASAVSWVLKWYISLPTFPLAKITSVKWKRWVIVYLLVHRSSGAEGGNTSMAIHQPIEPSIRKHEIKYIKLSF